MVPPSSHLETGLYKAAQATKRPWQKAITNSQLTCVAIPLLPPSTLTLSLSGGLRIPVWQIISVVDSDWMVHSDPPMDTLFPDDLRHTTMDIEKYFQYIWALFTLLYCVGLPHLTFWILNLFLYKNSGPVNTLSHSRLVKSIEFKDAMSDFWLQIL